MLMQKLREANAEGYESTISKGHMVLSIPAEKRHYWSPQLDISFSENEDQEGTLIRCLLAPAPAVWTMFMFFYALAGFVLLVGLMIAGSQYTLDKNLWGLWLAAGAMIVGVILFLIAQVGKSLSRAEMEELKKFIEDADW